MGDPGKGTYGLRVGLAADHGGLDLKNEILDRLAAAGNAGVDFGAKSRDPADDYPDLVVPLARAVAAGEIDRGIACCGSGVGASVAANKIVGVRAALVTEVYSAHQGVEHDDLNVLCLGGRVVGPALAWDLVQAFLTARFAPEERFARRLRKIRALEES